jgi:hypothetical protein
LFKSPPILVEVVFDGRQEFAHPSYDRKSISHCTAMGFMKSRSSTNAGMSAPPSVVIT